jgi:putative restriction endonuclease
MDTAPEFTSDKLTVDTVYTRNDLRDRFGIKDATLNTGIFRPKGTSSVWLFVTEEKTSDRTQYRDHLDGDNLYWQGQTSGRTDSVIISHQDRDLELLVFFRKRKYEHPRAGFQYLGPFVYTSNSGSGPTSFTLSRTGQAHPITWRRRPPMRPLTQPTFKMAEAR